MNEIIISNNGEQQFNLDKAKSQFARERLLEITLETINNNLNDVSTDISNNHEEIKARCKQLENQNKELLSFCQKLLENTNKLNQENLKYKTENIISKIESIAITSNVKNNSKNKLLKAVKSIVKCGFDELPKDPSTTDWLKIEEFIKNEVEEIKKSKPQWFKLETIETDNEKIKKIWDEYFNCKEINRQLRYEIQELKNSAKIKSQSIKDMESMYKEEIQTLKEEVYELTLEMMNNK